MAGPAAKLKTRSVAAGALAGTDVEVQVTRSGLIRIGLGMIRVEASLGLGRKVDIAAMVR